MKEREEQGAREQIEDMEDRAGRMEDRSQELEREIEGARSDWESKKKAEGTPGAQDEAGASDTDEEALHERRQEDEGESQQ